MLNRRSAVIIILAVISVFSISTVSNSKDLFNSTAAGKPSPALGANQVSQIIVTLLSARPTCPTECQIYISPDGKSHKLVNVEQDAPSSMRSFPTRDTLLAAGFYAGPDGRMEFQSPDGLSTLSVTTSSGTNNTPSLLFAIENSDGSNAKTIGSVTGAAFIVPPAWSPDRKKVLIPELVPDPKQQGNFQLRFQLLSLDGSTDPKVITPEKPVYIPQAMLMEALPFIGNQLAYWTPDGKEIITNGNLDAQPNAISLLIMDADGKNVSSLLGDSSKSVVDLSVSPDGKHLLFILADNKQGSRVIATTNADGSNLQLFTTLNTAKTSDGRPIGYVTTPTWSPDGSQIAFMVNLTQSVWVMNADGTNPHEVFDLTKQGNIEMGAGSWVYSLAWKSVDTEFLNGLPTPGAVAKTTSN